MKWLILIALCFTSISSYAKSGHGKIIDSYTVASTTTSVISEIVNLGDAQRFSLFSYLGTGSSATGTVSVLLSNDKVATSDLVTNWLVYGTDKTFTLPTTKLLSNITDVATKWVKVEYTKAGVVTGTLSTIIYIP